MPKKISLSVFIPAYNEAGNIKDVLYKTSVALKRLPLTSEILFVDDGSTDKTWIEAKIASKKYTNLRLFRHLKNLGLTAAFNTCLINSRGEIILFLPSDLQSNPIEDIPKLLSEIKSGYDIVAGVRKRQFSFDVLDSTIFNLIIRLLFNTNCRDINWIKAFKKDLFSVPLKEGQHRLLIPLAKMKGRKVGTTTVTYFPRKYGVSKFGFRRVPSAIIDILKLRFL